MERIVLALGGSIVSPPGEPDPQALIQWTEAIKAWSQDVQVLVVVGGGDAARKAITLARHGSTIEEDLDLIGVAATRLNANVFLTVLKGNGVDTYHHVPRTTAKAAELAGSHDVVVMGGTTPGHSTDYVAAELAKAAGAARVVIATNVDGVYTVDPNQHADAERLPRLSHDELIQVVGETWTTAGAKTVVDGPCARFLREQGIDACVVSGRNLTNVGNAVRGEAFDGTLVTAGEVAA